MESHGRLPQALSVAEKRRGGNRRGGSPLRLFSIATLGAGVSFLVAVTFLDLLGRALFRLDFRVLRFLTATAAFLLFRHVDPLSFRTWLVSVDWTTLEATSIGVDPRTAQRQSGEDGQPAEKGERHLAIDVTHEFQLFVFGASPLFHETGTRRITILSLGDFC